MTKLILYFFDKWWLPILYFVLTLGLFVISEFIEYSTFDNISIILFGLGLIVLIISAIYQFLKKRWIKGLLTAFILLSIIPAFVFYSLFSLFKDTLEGDKWADDLKIPKNIPIDTPIDLRWGSQRQDSVLAWTKSKIDFQLYNSFQPGLYEFDFWSDKIDSGIIYLKAFEITQEYALSTKSLREKSAIKVKNTTDSILKFSSTTYFTIYEGDWGKPYAARFEVWYKPENNGEEKKLFEKNYKIEGWMR